MTPIEVDSMSAIVEPAGLDITQAFRRVNDVLPEGQELLSVPYDYSVSDVLALMQERRFSQVPVKAGDETLGIFSFRSLAAKISEYEGERLNLGLLPVGDFIETTEYVHILEDIAKLLNPFEKQDSVLVGTKDDLVGVLTPIDLAKYLFKLSSPFVWLGEIELSLRNIIRSSMTPDQLQKAMALTLSEIYKPDAMPASVDDMSFNDYIQVIGDGRAWKAFERAFGTGDLQRKRTRAKLETVRDLRNIVFHFRRSLDETELGKLLANRDWLKNIASALQAKIAQGHHE